MLMPSVWIDWSPDAPKEVFNGRTEGYLAPILFQGDLGRLEIIGDALLTMTKTSDGQIIQMTPGLPISADELRFKREDLERLAKKLNNESPAECDPVAESNIADDSSVANDDQIAVNPCNPLQPNHQ